MAKGQTRPELSTGEVTRLSNSPSLEPLKAVAKKRRGNPSLCLFSSLDQISCFLALFLPGDPPAPASEDETWELGKVWDEKSEESAWFCGFTKPQMGPPDRVGIQAPGQSYFLRAWGQVRRVLALAFLSPLSRRLEERSPGVALAPLAPQGVGLGGALLEPASFRVAGAGQGAPWQARDPLQAPPSLWATSQLLGPGSLAGSLGRRAGSSQLQGSARSVFSGSGFTALLHLAEGGRAVGVAWLGCWGIGGGGGRP